MSEMKKTQEAEIAEQRRIEVAERRRHDRFEAGFEVRVSSTNPSARRLDVEGTVRDASASGLGLTCREPFAAGDIVTVRAPGRSLQCIVRHSRPDGDLYTVGLELLSTSDGTDIQGSLRELDRSLGLIGLAKPPGGGD